jgi:hypothetical protein
MKVLANKEEKEEYVGFKEPVQKDNFTVGSPGSPSSSFGIYLIAEPYAHREYD